jgi:hypothetical protein
VTIHFEEVGPWAKLVEITGEGFYLKKLSKRAPRGIKKRAVELRFNKDLAIQARLQEVRGDLYVFRFKELDPSTILHLQKWMKSLRSLTETIL